MSARFVDEEETKVLKEDHFRSFPYESGEILIRRIPERIDDVISLGLSSYSDRITIHGIFSA